MFDHTGYVPILRRRSAELSALTNTLNEDFRQVTPLFEMCEQILPDERREALADVDNNVYFYDVIKSLASCCGRKPYFIDFVNVEDVFSIQRGRHPIEAYFDVLDFHLLEAIPVTGLNRSDAFQTAIEKVVRSFGTAVCLRLTHQDIRDPLLVPKLQLVLRRFQLSPERVDLLVDLKLINHGSPSIEEICSRLPMLTNWRTFTVASGAFPEFLSELEKNSEHELDRSDWLHWKLGVSGRSKLPRIPTYSDYTIQFPQAPKPLKFLPNVSASIRYSAPEYWVVMRGEGLRNQDGAKFDQYWGQANSLMYRDEYSGGDFSFGDQYVSRIGSQTKQTGNPATWLRAGINRHIALTTRQISQYFSQAAGTQGSGRFRRPPLRSIWNASRLVLPDNYGQGYLFPPE